jgi:hypothetical protein
MRPPRSLVMCACAGLARSGARGTRLQGAAAAWRYPAVLRLPPLMAVALLASCAAPDAAAPDAAPAPAAAVRAARISAEIEVDAPVAGRGPHGLPHGVVHDGEGWVALVSPGVLLRVGPDGAPVPPFAAELDARYDWLQRAITSDGDGVAVVYPGTGDAPTLYWRRYDRALAPVGARLELAAGSDTSAYYGPAIAYGAGQYLAVWSDGTTPSTVWGRRISRDGRLLDDAPIRVSTAAGEHEYPAVAWDGESFVVVWTERVLPESGRVLLARVSAGGVVRDADVLVAEQAIGAARVAVGDGVYAVTWTSDVGVDVVTRRLAPDLTWRDPAPIVIGGGDDTQGESSVAWSGDRFLVTWVEGAGLGGRSIAVDGRDLPASGPPGPVVRLSPPGHTPVTSVVASGPAGAFAAWEGGATRIQPWGTVLDPSGPGMVRRVNRQDHPALAAGGGGYLAAWLDDRSDAPGVYARRLDAAGAPVGAAVRLPGGRGAPQVAFDGEHFLVAWSRQETSLVEAVRLAADGTVEDAAPLTAPGAEQLSATVRVAAGDDGFLATWASPLGWGNVHGWRIPPEGAPGAPFPVAATEAIEWYPRVVRDGEHYRVLWTAGQRQRSARVSDDGVVLDPGGIDGGAIGDRTAVVAGSAGPVIVWIAPSSDAVRAARLVDGVVTPAAGVAIGRSDQASPPALAFDGATIAVAWRRRGAVASTRLRPDATQLGGEIAVATVDADAVPVIAAHAPGAHLVAYSRFDAEALYRANRVRVRRVELAARGESCGGGAQCASGYCSDGVCCDAACGGADPGDCQACSRAAGAAEDGTCGLLGAGALCRAATGACDLAETCSGAAPACPDDAPADDGTPCPDGACRAGVCRLVPDAGPPDAAPPDAGPDAAPDAAPPDAAPDAAPPVDASAPIDAAASPDAAAPADAARAADDGDDGCGCRSSRPGAGLALLLAVAALARRRRSAPVPPVR